MMDHELEGAFFRDIPQQLIIDLGKSVFDSYKVAISHCKQNLAREQAHDTSPHYLRAHIEDKCQKTARKYPNVWSVPKLNKKKNAYHTEIMSRKVVLTISAVDKPNQFVRPANFRSSLAKGSQLKLELGIENDNIPDDLKLYALLLHGLSQVDKPYFINIAFPHPEGYYVHNFSLLKMFPELMPICLDPIEEITPVKPKFKEIAPNKENDVLG